MPKIKPYRYRYNNNIALMYNHRIESLPHTYYDKMVKVAIDKIDSMSKEELLEMYFNTDKTGPKVDEFLSWQTYNGRNNNG